MTHIFIVNPPPSPHKLTGQLEGQLPPRAIGEKIFSHLPAPNDQVIVAAPALAEISAPAKEIAGVFGQEVVTLDHLGISSSTSAMKILDWMNSYKNSNTFVLVAEQEVVMDVAEAIIHHCFPQGTRRPEELWPGDCLKLSFTKERSQFQVI